MSKNLLCMAGADALDRIRQGGLTPADVSTVAGAAGGPKCLVLAHLDRMLFSRWFGPRTEPLFLVGSSIGAWRFAAAAQNDPEEAIERFHNAYLSQAYSDRPGPAEVTREARRGLDSFVDQAGVREVLSHPFMRLSILSVRSRRLTAVRQASSLTLGFAAAILANAVRRRFLGMFFERGLFYDPRDVPPFRHMNEFPMQACPLTANNLKAALMATGAIPMVMEAIRDIPGAVPGFYRDGGVLDYHLNLPFGDNPGKLVLFPHYTDRIIPGWLDKGLKWRRPRAEYMKNVLVVAPSREFVKKLPFGKIPDRNDFRTFQGRDAERKAYWRRVMEAGRRLADDFFEWTASGRIREQVVPFTDDSSSPKTARMSG